MKDSDEGRIPTNLRALRILEVIGGQSAPLTAAEIGRAVGLPKQTIHRLCHTLVDEGYLARDATGLRPGRRARKLAGGVLHASTSHIARHQILRRLAQETGETVNFVVPESEGMSYRDRVETDWPFRVQLPVGSHVPFHCTASGKTFLASVTPKERKRMVETLSLSRETQNTITEPALLLNELKKVRQQGFALDAEEFISGMAAIAVPVRDQDGRYVAAIGVHGPVQRLSARKAVAFAPVMEEAARRLKDVLADA